MIKKKAKVAAKKASPAKKSAKPTKAKKSPAKKSAKPAKKEEKGKKKKDPNAPKRPMAAFMYFSSANRDKIKKDNPGCTFGEVGKYLGAAWAKVDAKTKAKFQEMADKDKTRYDKEMAKYNK